MKVNSDKLDVVCPIAQFKPDPLWGPALNTFKWALVQRKVGVLTQADKLRAKFIASWDRNWGDKKKDLNYSKGPRASISFARRVYDFLVVHDVVHPYEPDDLILGEHVIRTESCVVRRIYTGNKPVLFSVNAWPRKPRDIRVPNMQHLSSWYRERLAFDEPDLRIVNVPLLFGEVWTNPNIDEGLVKDWLIDTVKKNALESQAPVPGAYCVKCKHPCTEVFYGQDDYYQP